MTYEHWVKGVLADPDLSFSKIIKGFQESEDDSSHLDRHVWEPLEEPLPLLDDFDSRLAVCRAGLEILTAWQTEWVGNLQGVVVSRPLLIIDDEWLDFVENATPPHLYLCMAKDASNFHPVTHVYTREKATGHGGLDGLLRGSYDIRRIEGSTADEAGAWLLSVKA